MKNIKAKATTGQLLWVLTPDASLASIIKRKLPITYLDIFYVFAQQLVTAKENKQWREGVKCTILDLNNRVAGMNYIVKEITKYELKLLHSKNVRKNIIDYKPFQNFLVLMEAYLNCLHSIKDLIKNIDVHLGQKYYEDLMKEDWFMLNLDLRTLCHHIETPLVTVEGGVVIFRFERSSKIQTKRFLTDSMKDAHGIMTFTLTCSDLGIGMEMFLNQWAKRHLKNIGRDKTFKQIMSVKGDGTHKLRSISLGSLMDIAESSIKDD